MGIFKRFSALGMDAYGRPRDIIEHRDCLYAPYAQKRSSYLYKKDAFSPCYEFKKKLPEDKSQLKISKINFSDDKEKVKKLTKTM